MLNPLKHFKLVTCSHFYFEKMFGDLWRLDCRISNFQGKMDRLVFFFLSKLGGTRCETYKFKWEYEHNLEICWMRQV